METKLVSVTEYAKIIKKTRQAVLLQIKEKRLQEGVTAELVSNSFYVIRIKDNELK